MKKKFTVMSTAVLIALLPCFGLGRGANGILQAGQAVTFELQKLGGGTLKSSDLKGRVVLLAIGAKSSPLDRYLLPQLATIAAKMQGREVEVIWISTDGEKTGARGSATDDELRAFAEKYHFNGTVLRDPSLTLERQLGLSQLPALLLLDRKGTMSGTPRMGLDPEADLTKDLIAQLERLLA